MWSDVTSGEGHHQLAYGLGILTTHHLQPLTLMKDDPSVYHLIALQCPSGAGKPYQGNESTNVLGY